MSKKENKKQTYPEIKNFKELVERYNKDMAASGGKEEPKNIIQRIIDDYQMVSHEHKR